MTAATAPSRNAYQAIARWVAERQQGGMRVLGINGAQGSGKSTLAAFLVAELKDRHGLDALALSLDDFYLGRAARAELAATVHPLLAARGVPGTHDVARGIDCLHRLKESQPCTLPAFSKADDDVLGPRHERVVDRPPDLVLFEGWCVGTPPQSAAELAEPVNELERVEDADGAWRHYVNGQLAGPYRQWFSMLDALVFLQVPGWDMVRQWRAQQERETAAANDGHSELLKPGALDRFLQHYQRLTQHALRVLPAKADLLVTMDLQHVLRVGTAGPGDRA